MIDELLRNDYTIEEAMKIQWKYRDILKKKHSEYLKLATESADIHRILGVDISYIEQNDENIGVSCAVVFDIDAKKVLYKCFAQNRVNFPYTPGFLGFRECPLLAQAILKVPIEYDVIVCDGHGIIHPRRFGEAVHLGIALGKPSFGIAKNPFYGYSDWRNLKRKKGNKTPVWNLGPKKIKDGSPELLGYALCLREGSKPVFVSVGYKTSIQLALNVSLKTSTIHRLPDPLYLADYFSRQKIKKLIGS